MFVEIVNLRQNGFGNFIELLLTIKKTIHYFVFIFLSHAIYIKNF